MAQNVSSCQKFSVSPSELYYTNNVILSKCFPNAGIVRNAVNSTSLSISSNIFPKIAMRQNQSNVIRRNLKQTKIVCLGTKKNDELRGNDSRTADSFTKNSEKRNALNNFLHEKFNKILSISLAVACSFNLLTADISALAETEPFIEPSPFSELAIAQRTLVEVWGIVRETYVDRSFNDQDWDGQLQQNLASTFSNESSDYAYDVIRSMLSSLGDPFTRFVTPKEYQSFRISNDGALEGVGLLIASEPGTGRKIVLSPIEGGPAARAGIVSGDEIVRINDETVMDTNGDELVSKLRGKAGTSVSITYRRSMESEGEEKITQVQLKRETIVISPVFSTLLSHADVNGDVLKTGYIRLSSFSQNAAEDMEKAVVKLESQGVSSYILDLRNNPGGLVRAGLEVAQIWLDGDETLVNTIDREGNMRPVLLRNGHSLTQQPLAILVNNGSASASEILAGALHDNGRAILVGDKTYGKGKIQSVFELGDGSALFVTVAKYLSPALNQIDLVGITPDVGCMPEPVPVLDNQVPVSMNALGEPTSDRSKVLFADLSSQLQSDMCVLTAENKLVVHTTNGSN